MPGPALYAWDQCTKQTKIPTLMELIFYEKKDNRHNK